MNIRDHSTVASRRKTLEKERGVVLSHSGSYSLDDTVASTKNCENMIGVTQIPLGIAGPLKVKSLKFNVQSYYLPLATTEGALVASVNRGCKAITESGGATVDSYRVGATRGPVFQVENLQHNDALNTFLDEHFDELASVARKTSSHIALKRFFSRGLGRQRFVRFIFDTEEAMGMNMVTIATDALVGFIEEKTGARCTSVAGNYDVDKKPSWLNTIEGRGIKAWAEIILPKAVLRDVLKTSAQELFDVWLSKCMIGSAISGSMGFNAHYANILAAIFLATGQDIAHVGEASCGITTMEIVKQTAISKQQLADDIYVSVYLPDLMVGTVGGGTGLSTQKEALAILGITQQKGSSAVLAQVIAGAVLASEVSLLSSLAQGSLSRAHQKLARGKHEE